MILLAVSAPRWRWDRSDCLVHSYPAADGAVPRAVLRRTGIHRSGSARSDQVYALFQDPALVLAGWIHYLAFDLFIGSWEVRDARRIGIPHLLVVPCLIGTFLVGPVGLLLYLLLRFILQKRIGADE